MTSITEIASDVFRISTYVRESNIQFNQFLVRDEQPLLFHTGHKRLFPQVREAVATILVGTAALARVLAGLGVFDPQVPLVIASTSLERRIRVAACISCSPSHPHARGHERQGVCAWLLTGFPRLCARILPSS